MNLNLVALESTPFVPSHLTFHSELKRKDAHGTDSCASAERRPSDSPLRQLLIQKALRKIADHGLFGREHVWSSCGLKSRPRSCPYALVAQGNGVLTNRGS